MCSLLSSLRLLRKALANTVHIDEHIHEAVVFQLRRELMTERMLRSEESGVTDKAYFDGPLIVTLTTHGRRINTVYQSIESVFGQSCKPNRVVLYLSEDDFRDEDLPVSLQRQCARGLEIRYVRDVGPHTKLVPALQEFPEAYLLTVDDDIFYPFDMIEKLIRLHRDHPKDVCCTISRRMGRSGRTLTPFKEMRFVSLKRAESSMHFLAEGFSGVLYPPHSLHPDVTRDDLFRQLAPTADDLWFKAMELRQGTAVCQMPGADWKFPWTTARDATVQDDGLFVDNIAGGKNDAQLKALFDYYDLYDKLEE